VKIGGIGWEAPRGELLQKQIKISQEILQYELSHANADAIIFLTGNGYYSSQIQNQVAGESSTWTLDAGREWICQKNDDKFGLLMWIDHPQYRSNEMRDYVSGIIAEAAVRRWEERTRRQS
jgi:hypothetical protein